MMARDARTQRNGHWTFLSNHAHVLVCLRRSRHPRVRDIAEAVGITERAVLLILSDLEAEGIVERVREGRRNHYVLNLETPLRHPLEAHRSVRQLLDMVGDERRRSRGPVPKAASVSPEKTTRRKRRRAHD